MKRFSVTISPFISSVVVVTATVLGSATAVLAQTFTASDIPTTIDQASFARLTADLAYPNSSQRFFEGGNAQVEQEIRRMLHDDEQSEPLLTIKSEVLEQFDDK